MLLVVLAGPLIVFIVGYEPEAPLAQAAFHLISLINKRNSIPAPFASLINKKRRRAPAELNQ